MGKKTKPYPGPSIEEEDIFKRDFRNLSPRNQFLIAGVIKDLVTLKECPDDFIPYLVKERAGRK